MARYNNSSALAVVPVADVARGTYVKRVSLCDACNGDGCTDNGPCNACEGRGYHAHLTVYTRQDFDRSTKKYALEDTNDVNREVFLKGTARVLVGFTY